MRVAVLALLLYGCSVSLIDPTPERPLHMCESSHDGGRTLFERVLVVGAPDPETWTITYPDRERFHGDLLKKVVSRGGVRPCPAGMWGTITAESPEGMPTYDVSRH